MDTVETRTEEQPAAEAVYDGFISYSHAADDLLAPRLQAGLQRFAPGQITQFILLAVELESV